MTSLNPKYWYKSPQFALHISNTNYDILEMSMMTKVNFGHNKDKENVMYLVCLRSCKMYFSNVVNHISLFLETVSFRFCGWAPSKMMLIRRWGKLGNKALWGWVITQYYDIHVFLWFCKPYFSVSGNCICLRWCWSGDEES